MNFVLLGLALAGMLLGLYSLLLPAMQRRGWSVPLAGIFSSEGDDEDDIDVPLVGGFDGDGKAPRKVEPRLEAKIIAVPPVRKRPEPLPELADLEPPAVAAVATEPPLAGPPQSPDVPPPAVVVVAAEPEATQPPTAEAGAAPVADGAEAPVADAATGPVAETPVEPAPEATPSANPLAGGEDDMLSYFDEEETVVKVSSVLKDAVQEVSAVDLLKEAQSMRALLHGDSSGNRAA